MWANWGYPHDYGKPPSPGHVEKTHLPTSTGFVKSRLKTLGFKRVSMKNYGTNLGIWWYLGLLRLYHVTPYFQTNPWRISILKDLALARFRITQLSCVATSRARGNRGELVFSRPWTRADLKSKPKDPKTSPKPGSLSKPCNVNPGLINP